MECKTELRVRRDVCIGCGLCAETCPRQAISIQWGQAQIDQGRCNHCGLCLDVCPQGAIVELVPISKGKLEATVTSLRQKADELIERIENLKKQDQ
jgi:formate hydrogenlyase subunit 6/NADH:ubiquinone oxidoreductase subunit I